MAAYSASLSNFPGGSYSVQAHYAGDGTYAPSDSNPVTLTVTPESSTTTLQSLLYNPSSGVTTSLANGASYPYGGYILVRADVAGVSGKGSATGNVLFTDLGAPLDGGTFRLNSTSNTEDQTRGLVPGNHVITASYSGDASFNGSTSPPLAINITKAQTTSALQVDLPVLSEAGILTFTAQVNARGFGAGGQQGFGAVAPTGMITLTSGALSFAIGTLTQNTYPAFSTDSGTVSVKIPANLLPVGVNTVIATYSGDTNYNPSTSSPVSVTVTGATEVASTTTLSLSANMVSPGSGYTFTATIAKGSAQSSGPQPTGSVTFFSDGQPVGPAATLFSGTASISGSSLAIGPGAHLITAMYSGDANYQASISTPASFTIAVASLASGTSMVVTPSTVAQGTTVTIAASITPASPTPAGTVQLMLDGNVIGTPVAVTGATTNLPLPTNTFQSGAHILRVLYSGDSSHQASKSDTATLTILDPAGGFTLSLSTSSATAVLGKASTPITLTATPTGGFHSAITFSCNGGLPSGAACVFLPSSITPNGSSATTVLTISSAAAVLQAREDSGHPRTFTFAPRIAVTLSCLVFFLFPRRRRWSGLILLFAFFTVGLVGLTGCGSGVVGPNAPNPGALSAGSYTITVAATGGSTIQTATVNLIIQ